MQRRSFIPFRALNSPITNIFQSLKTHHSNILQDSIALCSVFYDHFERLTYGIEGLGSSQDLGARNVLLPIPLRSPKGPSQKSSDVIQSVSTARHIKFAVSNIQKGKKSVLIKNPKIIKNTARTVQNSSLKTDEFSALVPKTTTATILEYAVDCYTVFWANHLQNGEK